MKYDLKTPCKNCPFRNDESRITFSCKERAEEIAESAYRNGFPCHLSAAHDDNDEGGGFYDDGNAQHCAGFIIMKMKEEGGEPWPGIDNDEELAERLSGRIDWAAPVFESEEEFIEANNNKT